MSVVLAERLKPVSDKVAEAWGIAINESLRSAASTDPTPFALKFLDTLPNPNGHGGLVAFLGSGFGRDALYFVERGYDVAAYELVPLGREITRRRFEERGLAHRLKIGNDFHDTSGLAPKSLDGALAVQSLNYLAPDEFVEVLSMYKRHVKDDGLFAIVSRFKDSDTSPRNPLSNPKRYSVPADVFRMQTIDPESTIPDKQDEYAFAFDMPISDRGGTATNPILRTWVYTGNQLRIIAKVAGYEVIDALPWFIDNPRLGMADVHIYVLLKPKTQINSGAPVKPKSL